MRPLSEATARIAGKSFERKYIALGRIVKHWSDIVGAKLADKAQPAKIHYRRKGKDEKLQATLEIAASSADATLLHYQKDLILERINQIFGERWITGIKFVHIASNLPAPAVKQAPRSLTDEEQAALTALLSSVEDDEMKARLEILGRAVFTDNTQEEKQL